MQEIYDLVIIGSGPAGLSAAVYGMRAGLNLLVVERNPMSGGQVLNTYEVDNYLGMPGINGFDMGVKFREHADKLGAPFLEAEVTGLTEGEIKTVHTTEGDLRAKAVILATGAHHAQLEVPGEEALSGMGVSYCATCDGAFYRGKTVAVVGGGDVALEDAIYLTRFCEKVYLIHRRDELRGAHVLQEQLRALPGAEILYSHVVKEIQGQEAVTGVLLEDLKAESGASCPWTACLWLWAYGLRQNCSRIWRSATRRAMCRQARTAPPAFPASMWQGISAGNRCVRW